MKRSLVVLVALVLLVAACATSTPAGTGTITAINPGSVTVTDNGQAKTFSTGFTTDVWWGQQNTQAGLNSLAVGQHVTVYGSNGAASKIVIE